ncbi:hypothetical protein EI94DRAFT_1727487, partial [Lactarius quietus]
MCRSHRIIDCLAPPPVRYRCRRPHALSDQKSHVLQKRRPDPPRHAKEGLLYYSVICAVTLTLTVTTVGANQSVRDTTAQLDLCLTVTMMSRITLRPKRFAYSNTTINAEDIRWNVTRHRLPTTSGRLHHAPRHDMSTLQAAPRTPVWSTVREPEGETFALESIAPNATFAPPPAQLSAPVPGRLPGGA